MKKDDLEQFVAAHSAEFDTEEPNPLVWNRIEKELSPKAKKIAFPVYIWQAAAASIIFIAAWFGNDAYRNYFSSKNRVETVQLSTREQQFANDVKETLVYYNHKIESKKQLLLTLTSSNPEVDKEVNIAFDELDKTLKELKNDLKDGADNQEVIEAVIQNYRLKLKILEEMLTIMAVKNGYENENNNNQNGQIKI